MTTPLPMGFRISMDAGVRPLADGTWLGGSPARAFRLTAAGARAMAELRDGPIASAGGGALARRLTDAGFAHPRPRPNKITIGTPRS